VAAVKEGEAKVADACAQAPYVELDVELRNVVLSVRVFTGAEAPDPSHIQHCAP
jgi:hypothetical protein